MGQTADWLIKSGDWDEGESRYLSLLKEAPNASLVHRGLAELYLRQGRGVEATAFLRNLCRLGDVQEYELRHLLIARYPFPGDATPENFDPIGRLGLAKAQAAYADWGSVANSLILDDQSTPEEVGLKDGVRWSKRIGETLQSGSVILMNVIWTPAIRHKSRVSFLTLVTRWGSIVNAKRSI